MSIRRVQTLMSPEFPYGYLADLAMIDLGTTLMEAAEKRRQRTKRGAALLTHAERIYGDWPQTVWRRPTSKGSQVRGLPRPPMLPEQTRAHLVVDSAFVEPFDVIGVTISADERRSALRVLATDFGLGAPFADRVLQVIESATRDLQRPSVDAAKRSPISRAKAAGRVARRGATPGVLGPDATRELVRPLAHTVAVDVELCGDPRAADEARLRLAERRGTVQDQVARLRETGCPEAEIREAEANEGALANAIDWLVRQ